MENTLVQFRFTVAGVACIWRQATMAEFLRDCTAWAENGVEFSVEFQ